MDPSALETFWFVLIAVLWTGYLFLEGFDFGVGHAPAHPRPRRRGAPLDHRHDRPGLGRQRGVAPHRGRRHLRGLPRVVRHPLLGLLPGALPDPGRPDRAGRGLRVPRASTTPRAGARRGTRRSWSAAWCRRSCGAWPSPTWCAAWPSTRTTSTRGPSGICSTPTRCSAAWPCSCSAPRTGAIFLTLRTDGDLRERARALARPLTGAVVVGGAGLHRLDPRPLGEQRRPQRAGRGRRRRHGGRRDRRRP